MIVFDGLTKRYGTATALDRVSFTAPAGTITGLLGPNGAGKSTTLRILLGLARADSGRASIADRRYPELANPALLAGSLLDADCFHPGRTAKESLRLACLTIGLPLARVTEVLDEVGLSAKESRRRVRTFSLGMRQRLGLALALLGRPAALILDEPANGLDPHAQRWLADLLRAEAARGCAVLLSSHQLAEVEQLADRLVLIDGGRVLADDTPDRLRAEYGSVARFYFARTAGRDHTA
ncbi:ABC transporter ATP-binding protein [Rhizomonospora bruguierae]|uniref:ABC transporter ATP-binding protein n=1 Tax=Rhizomonospora bruguierae TaxID=1581705 RepID=UPI001BD0B5EB|nr:ATP-binding cassette domain-containing protein [Micromonospora sp. NBRC 107566]